MIEIYVITNSLKTFQIWEEADIKLQEVQRVPEKINPKRFTLRHNTINMLNIKDKNSILKAREKQLVISKGNP